MNDSVSIPDGWDCKPISYLIDSLNSGVSVNSQDAPASLNEFGILKTSCIFSGKFYPNENKTILEKDIVRARLNPSKGAIIISRMNTPELVGESGLVTKSEPNLFLPDRLWQTQFKDGAQIDSYWFSSLIQEVSVKKRIQDIATGTSNSMKNISKQAFLNLEILIPSFREQVKISQILSLIDEQIELTEKLIKKKRLIKKGLLSELLSRYSKGSDNTIILNELLYGVRGVSYTPSQLLSEQSSHSFTLLRSNNIKDNRINFDSIQLVPKGLVSDDQKAVPGDIAVCMSNGSKSLVGKSASFSEGIKGLNVTVGAFCSIFKPKDRVDAHFLSHLFQSSIYQKHIDIVLAGSAINNLQNKVIEGLKIPHINKNARFEIGEILNSADVELDSLISELAKLKLQKQGLMQDLLTGRVRVS